MVIILFFQTCMCDTTPDSCKRCCRMNLNTSCFVMQPEEMLPDGNSNPIHKTEQESIGVAVQRGSTLSKPLEGLGRMKEHRFWFRTYFLRS